MLENRRRDNDVVLVLADIVILNVAEFDIGRDAVSLANFHPKLDELRTNLQTLAIEAICLAEYGKPTGTCSHLEDPHARLHFAKLADEIQVPLIRRNFV